MPADPTSQTRLAYPLLATRFFPPPLRANFVPRPRLMEHMGQALQVPLTLISAPPGFGKSTLISQWINHIMVESQPSGPDKVADEQVGWTPQAKSFGMLRTSWLSIDPSDNEWALFYRYLVTAWQRIFPRVGEEAVSELNSSPSIPSNQLVNLFLNDLMVSQESSNGEQALLILDDYHRIENPAIHETIAYLVEHIPPGCHLALLTRADPPLPLARWRLRGLVFEVRADDLRFSIDETKAYLQQNTRFEWNDTQIDAMHDRMEGWAAGVQMASIAMQSRHALQGSHSLLEQTDVSEFVRDFGASNRFVFDYLIEEVVSCQPETVQQFLLATACLDQLCGPLCAEVTGISPFDAQQMLERLDKGNLFLIALDDHRVWYRYHHLFSDLLKIKQRQSQPEQANLSHRRAAGWYSRNGLWREATLYAMKTGDWDFSAQLFEQAILSGGLDFLYGGIQPLVDSFPEHWVQTRPLISLAKAVAKFERSQLDGIVSLLRFAEQEILSSPAFPKQNEVLGWIYITQSNVATLLGDSAWTIAASQQVSRWIPDNVEANIESLLQLGNAYYYEGSFGKLDVCWQQALDMSVASNNTYYTLLILDCLGRISCQKGELNRAETLFQRGIRLMEQHPQRYRRWQGAIQRDYSDLLRERNFLPQARKMLEKALPLCDQWDSVSGYGLGCVYMARICLADADWPGADEMLTRVELIHRTHTIYPDLESLTAVTRAQLYLEAGDTDRAWQVLDTCMQSDCCRQAYHREGIMIAQARILWRTGRMIEASNRLAELMAEAKENGRGRNWLVLCLIAALSSAATCDWRNAFQHLEEALIFAQEQSFRQVFVEEGKPMLNLLATFRVQFPQSPVAGYVAGLLSIFPTMPENEFGVTRKVGELDEPLSPREEEILRLVCQGLSNQEIAGQLVLSVGTVKSHIHHIFGKLGVRDRPQAIAKAAHSIK